MFLSNRKWTNWRVCDRIQEYNTIGYGLPCCTILYIPLKYNFPDLLHNFCIVIFSGHQNIKAKWAVWSKPTQKGHYACSSQHWVCFQKLGANVQLFHSLFLSRLDSSPHCYPRPADSPSKPLLKYSLLKCVLI